MQHSTHIPLKLAVHKALAVILGVILHSELAFFYRWPASLSDIETFCI